MGKYEKLLLSILCGSKDRDIDFTDLCKVLESLEFESRVKGSHYIFYRTDVVEILNLQPDGNKAKPYQVKQVRQVILKYKLGGNVDVEI